MSNEIDTHQPKPLDYGSIPIGGTGNIHINENIKILKKNHDTIEKSSEDKDELFVNTKSDQPIIFKGFNTPEPPVQDFKANPWLQSYFLLALVNILAEIFRNQSNIRAKESEDEISKREEIIELAKTNAKLARELTENQAREQRIQAMASFANAAVSAGQAIQTTRNLGAAERKTQSFDQDITNQKQKLNTAQVHLDDMQSPGSNIQVGTAPSSNPVSTKGTTAQIQAAQDAVNKEQQKYDSLVRQKDTKKQEELRHMDQQTQILGQTYQSTINGVQQVLSSTIKSDSAVKEEMQKMNDGFMQSINKYSETASKIRDDAANNITRFIEFSNRMIESISKAHMINSRS